MGKQRDPKKYYDGKPCRTCGNTLRLLSTQSCVSCKNLAVAQWQQANPDRAKANSQQWRQRNLKRSRANEAAYKQNNRDRIKKRYRQYCRNNPHYLQGKNSRRRAKIKAACAVPYTAKQVKERFKQFGNQCVYCLTRKTLTVDHFFPLSKGGIDALKNLVPACRSCNSSKGDRDPITWMQQKGFNPAYINALVELILELAH